MQFMTHPRNNAGVCHRQGFALHFGLIGLRGLEPYYLKKKECRLVLALGQASTGLCSFLPGIVLGDEDLLGV